MHRAVGWGSLRPSSGGWRALGRRSVHSRSRGGPPGPSGQTPGYASLEGRGPAKSLRATPPRGSGIRPIRVYVTPGYTPLQGVGVPYRPLRRLRAQCRHWMSRSAVRPELTRTAGQAWLSRFAGGASRSRPRFPEPLDWPGFPGPPGVHPGRLDTVPDGRRGGLSVRRELTRADPATRQSSPGPPRRNFGPLSPPLAQRRGLQGGTRNPVAEYQYTLATAI